jgi:toxin YoeB
MKHIQITSDQCIGKPEPLNYGFSGYWRRRVNDENQNFYKQRGTFILIVQLRYQYV